MLFGASQMVLKNVKESTCNAGHSSLTPRLGGSLGEGNGNPLQYSCLENPMDRGVWWATVHGVNKEQRVGHDLVTKQHMFINEFTAS